MGEHPGPPIDVVPRHGFGQRHDFEPFRGAASYGAGSGGKYHQSVGVLVLSSYFEPADQPGHITTAFRALRTGDVPAEVPKDHLHDLLFRHISLEQQGDRLGYRPPILAQQPFPQQAKMFVSPFVPGISELNPDLILTNVNGEGLQIIAFIIETSSALQIEAPTVPGAGENAVPDRPAGQGIAHMRTLVVGRVDPAIDIEQRDAAPFSEPYSLRLTHWNIAERGHTYPLRCMFGHISLLTLNRQGGIVCLLR